MADRDRERERERERERQQYQLYPQQQQQQQQQRYEGGLKNILPQKGPSASQVLAIVTLLPVSGTLLALSGITLAGSLIGLAVATPVFIIFSPVLVPAAILIAGAVTAFLTSGAFGLTGLSSLSWVLNSFRQATGREPLDYAKRRVQEATVQVGEKTRQVGETIKAKGQEGGREGREAGATVGAGAGRPA